MCANTYKTNTRNTTSNVRKTSVYYAKFGDDGETATYVFSLFGRPVYIRVRYREKMRNMFTWLLEPNVEKVGLTLSEVTNNGEA